MKTRYYICGLCYDENDRITDWELQLGDLDDYVEAYELFVQLQCRDPEWFFRQIPNVYKLLLQLEECEETDDAINCIGVKNEWWIVNPNFKEEI